MARQYTLQRHAAPHRINYDAELNPQQVAAVKAPPGPALVIAGAGSGKTRTLTYRVAWLLENGVPASSILLLTFTNKAAREMLERVTALLPNDVTGIWSGTFHSIGNRILRQHPGEAGFRKGFSIMDREDQRAMLDSVRASAGIDPKDKRFPKGEVLGDIFSFALNTGRPLDEVLAEKYPYFTAFEEEIAAVWKSYEARKKTANSVDFDDLLEKPLLLLQREKHIAEYYQKRFEFILVDEYQDTNRIQADFIDVLAARHRNIMVVGDDAQSIYSWRGANFKNILDFPKRYPGAKVFKIETNYRSVPQILDLANAAIAGNEEQFEKVLQPARDAASVKPGLVPLGDQNQQAAFVTQRIIELHEAGTPLDDIAVLYRAHYHSMELQMELTRHGVPFTITSGLRFFEQAHVKDVAAFLKFVVNPRDEVAFKRIAKLLPGIGNKSAELLWGKFSQTYQPPTHTDETRPGAEAGPEIVRENPCLSVAQVLLGLKVPAKAQKAWEQLAHTLDELAPGGVPAAPSAMIASVIEALYDDYLKANFANYDQRIDDLNVLTGYAREYDDPHEFLDQLALVSGVEDEDELNAGDDAEKVNLSSIHQAKGLEWKVVFVIWLTDGMFPSSRSLDSRESVEEERRLFYVAVTRAEDELYLTYPHLRMNAGYGEMMQQPSRFLAEIPSDLVEDWQVNTGF
jgi:DNA helicase II / ATP-dependent DNA helicase PcrA